MKNILIDKELFDALVFYHLFASREERDCLALNSTIIVGLEDKLKRVHLRNLYTESKMNRDSDLKEIARLEYLNLKGISEDFRW